MFKQVLLSSFVLVGIYYYFNNNNNQTINNLSDVEVNTCKNTKSYLRDLEFLSFNYTPFKNNETTFSGSIINESGEGYNIDSFNVITVINGVQLDERKVKLQKSFDLDSSDDEQKFISKVSLPNIPVSNMDVTLEISFISKNKKLGCGRVVIRL